MHRGPCRSQAEIAQKVQENIEGNKRTGQRCTRGSLPRRNRGRGGGEHKSRALGVPPVPPAVFCVIHTWKREKRMSDDFET